VLVLLVARPRPQIFLHVGGVHAPTCKTCRGLSGLREGEGEREKEREREREGEAEAEAETETHPRIVSWLVQDRAWNMEHGWKQMGLVECSCLDDDAAPAASSYSTVAVIE